MLEGIGIIFIILAGIIYYVFWFWGKQKSENKSISSYAPSVVTAVNSSLMGFDVRTETVKHQYRSSKRIILTGPPFLPTPLAMGSQSQITGSQIRLEVKDFAAVNRLIGREILDLNMVNDIKTITKYCQDFLIHKNKITCWLYTSVNPGHTESEVIHAAARLAGRLRDVTEETDVRLYFLLHNINCRRQFSGKYKNAVRLLLKYYDKTCPHVSALLQPLLESPDFELAFIAAAGLGKNITQFMYSQAENGGPASQAAAISEICGRKLEGAFDFLSGFFRRTSSIKLQRDIVTGLRKLSDERIPAFLVNILQEKNTLLKTDIIRSLTVRGDKTALGPLYALSRDLTQTDTLRREAGDAIAAILKRTGRGDGGMLSSSESSNEGGLSLPRERKEKKADSTTPGGNP